MDLKPGQIIFRAVFPYGQDLLANPMVGHAECQVSWPFTPSEIDALFTAVNGCEGCGTVIASAPKLDRLPMVSYGPGSPPRGPSGWWEYRSIERCDSPSSEDFGLVIAWSRFHDLDQCRARKRGETAYGD